MNRIETAMVADSQNSNNNKAALALYYPGRNESRAAGSCKQGAAHGLTVIDDEGTAIGSNADACTSADCRDGAGRGLHLERLYGVNDEERWQGAHGKQSRRPGLIGPAHAGRSQADAVRNNCSACRRGISPH